MADDMSKTTAEGWRIILDQQAEVRRKRLADERWRLENGYTGQPLHDGAVRDRIETIDQLLRDTP